MNGIALQPIVQLDGQVLGHEVLIRRRNEVGRWELPGDFLPEPWTHHVERWRVDMYVIGRVAHDPQLHRLPGALFINVCGATLVADDQFHEWITALRFAARSRANGIIAEVSEQARLPGDLLADRIARIRGVGVATAMDDFGTGNHRLPLLREPLWDWIKIWWPVVSRVEGELEEATEHCRVNNVPMIVEGVEQEADVERAKALRPLGLQGIAIGPPRILVPTSFDEMEVNA